MKILATLTLLVALASCSSSNVEFNYENGVCYRTRTQYTLGLRTDKAKTQAFPSNCGAQVPTTTETP